MTRVYIVLGQSGDYDDREVWVAGVYATEAEAQAAVVERMEVRMVYGEWKWRKEWSEHDCLAARDAAELAAGPKPEEEPAEYVALISCPVGQWGKWDEIDSWLGPKDVPPKEGESC